MAVKELREEGRSQGEIATLLSGLPKPWKLSPYQTRLYYGASAGKSMKRLLRAVELCSEADLALKLSPQGYIAIERLICSLS